MSTIIKILYLELAASDAIVAEAILKNAGLSCEILAINNRLSFTTALTNFAPGLIISDDALPSLNSVDALTILQETGLNIPLIVVSIPRLPNSITDIVTIMKHGAYDYILKENINTLPDAVLNAVKKHRAAQITNPELNRYISNTNEVFFSRDMLTLELIQISRGCERVYGYSVTEFMGDPGLYGKIYHAEDKHIFTGFIAQMRLGEQVCVQYRIVHKDGTLRWIESKIIPMLNENGTLVRIDGVSRDITDKKKAEDRIGNSNLRVMEAVETQSAILNALPATIALLNHEGTIVSVNDSWKKFADTNGFAMPDYGIGFNYVAISDKATGAEEQGGKEMVKGIATVVSGGQKEFTMEYPCDSPTEKRWFQVVVAPLANENIKGAVVVHFNITERKLAEEKTQRSEEMYRLIVETAQEGIWIINLNLETTFVNKKLCEMLGYPAGEIMGKHNYDFKGEGEKIKTFERLKNRKPGTIEAHESAFITKCGKLIFCRVITNAMFDASGKYLGLLAMLTDITAAKKLETERKKITNELIQRNKALEQFTYVISHNLRAPVANIIGLSSLVNCNDNENSEFCKIINGIGRSANKVDEVIADLNHVLDINGHINESVDTVFLTALIEDIKFSIRHLIDKEKVMIISDFEKADHLFSIKSFIYSIFDNLIINSIKYREPGVAPVINISTSVSNGKICINYKDNGRGIDTSKYASELFGLYKRFDTSVEGKGMGLFMVKTQVEGLGGTISLHSEPQKGTEFVIEFPQVLPAACA